METSVRFTPLTGVDAESPLCYLLEIDSFTILLDCGWDENFDEVALEPVKRYAAKGLHSMMAEMAAKRALAQPLYKRSKLFLLRNQPP